MITLLLWHAAAILLPIYLYMYHSWLFHYKKFDVKMLAWRINLLYIALPTYA